MNNATNTFAAYRRSLTLNGAALASFLVASGPAVVEYVCDRVERAERQPRLYATLLRWADANEGALMEACLAFEW
jgi:hypothetical protein